MPGQLVTSYALIASRTGLSIRNVRTCLKKLSKTKEVSVESSKKGTIITLLEFGNFQQFDEVSNAVGWIKLYRKIVDWSWYSNSEMVHLFVHLLLRATYQQQDLPNGLLGRAQLSISKNHIQQETGISIQCIKTCLNKLQDTGEIEILQNSAFHSNLITISNYCHYQGYSNVNGLNTNIIQNNFFQQNNLYVQNNDFEQEVTSESDFITNRYTESYKELAFQGDTQVTNNRQSIDMHPTNHRHNGDIQPTHNKERYKVEKDKISSTAGMYVREDFLEKQESWPTEENFAKESSVESFSVVLSQNNRWLRGICKRFRLANIEAAINLLDSFELDLLCRGKERHVNIQDYMSHFCDWVNKQKTQQPFPDYGSKLTPKHSSSEMIYTNQF